MLAADFSSALVGQKTALTGPSSVRATGDFGATLAVSLSNAEPLTDDNATGGKKTARKEGPKIQPAPPSSDNDLQATSLTALVNPPLPVPFVQTPIQFADVALVPLNVASESIPAKTGSEPLTLGPGVTPSPVTARMPFTVPVAPNPFSPAVLKFVPVQVLEPQSTEGDKNISEITPRGQAGTKIPAPTVGDPAFQTQRASSQIFLADFKSPRLPVAMEPTTKAQLVAEPAAFPLNPTKMPTQPSGALDAGTTFAGDTPQRATAQWTSPQAESPPGRTLFDLYRATGIVVDDGSTQTITRTTATTFSRSAIDVSKAPGTIAHQNASEAVGQTPQAPLPQSAFVEEHRPTLTVAQEAAAQAISTAWASPVLQSAVPELNNATADTNNAAPKSITTSAPVLPLLGPLEDSLKAISISSQQPFSQSITTDLLNPAIQQAPGAVSKPTDKASAQALSLRFDISKPNLDSQGFLAEQPTVIAPEPPDSQPRNSAVPDGLRQRALLNTPDVIGAASQQGRLLSITPSSLRVPDPLHSKTRLPPANDDVSVTRPSAKAENSSIDNSSPVAVSPPTRSSAETKSTETVSPASATPSFPPQSNAPDVALGKTQYAPLSAMAWESYSAPDAAAQAAELDPSDGPSVSKTTVPTTIAASESKDGTGKKSPPSHAPLPQHEASAPATLTKDAVTTVMVPSDTVSPLPAHPRSSETREAPTPPQLPEASASGPESSSTARVTTEPGGEMQMYVGIKTAAFGAVEIYTSVHQNQVGLSVRGEHGMAHWLGNEVQSIESGLKDHQLNLTTVEMDKSGTEFQTGSGSQQQQQQQHNFFAVRNSPNNLIRERTHDSEPIAAVLPGLPAWSAGNRVSIHV